VSAEVALVFWTVVGARFLLPLLIPRFPLPAVIACLVLDGIDQTIFQTFGYDPPGYQGYDKAMDVYYLAIAYLSTLRNWTSPPAFLVSRFLYFYRLVGVVAFELTQVRALLMIFPNTFEYFFIAYEGIRSRWNPRRFGLKFWVLAAAAIWVFVKLPQEYWIHIAQLDFTDTVQDYPWFGPLIVLGLLVLLAVFWFAVRPRLLPADWRWRIAADPLPEAMDSAAERDAWRAEHGRLLSMVTVEKVVLIGLISVIFGQVLPGLRSTTLQLFLAIGVFVVINTAISLATARASRSLESLTGTFLVRVAVNVGLVVAAEWLLGRADGSLNRVNAVFFVLLISLITSLHDRYQPVHEVRARSAP
jgi:hypothetical protein